MDASSLYPRGFHPVLNDMLPDLRGPAPMLKRKHVRVRYYWIDFRQALQIPENAPSRLITEWTTPILGPPEVSSGEPFDPFKVDVFMMARALMHSIINVLPCFNSWLITNYSGSRNTRIRTSCAICSTRCCTGILKTAPTLLGVLRNGCRSRNGCQHSEGCCHYARARRRMATSICCVTLLPSQPILK